MIKQYSVLVRVVDLHGKNKINFKITYNENILNFLIAH